jgi:hypothetical protein
MALKPVVSDLSEVPEAARPLYEAKDGKFVLPIEGDPVGKLAEFRSTNVELLKGLGVTTVAEGLARAQAFAGMTAEQLTTLKQVDPAEYKTLKAAAEKLKEKGLDNPDTADEKLKGLIADAVKPFAEKVGALETELKTARETVSEAAFRKAVGEAFIKAGGKADAVDFIVARAKESFVAKGDKIEAKPGIHSAEATASGLVPLGVEEWLLSQAKAVGFAFEPSSGGGAVGGNGSGSAKLNATGWKTASGKAVQVDGIQLLAQ